MALTNKRSNANFLARLAGLTGFLLAVVGLVLWAISLTEEGSATVAAGLGIALAILGGLLAIGTLVMEMQAVTSTFVSRRGAFGSNVVLQILLAAILLIGVNVFSFFHYERFDWTRDQLFSEIREQFGPQLGRLRGETSVVVFLRHSSFGQAAAKQDNYDSAAERVSVEKIKDIVEQFREFGPRFRVDVLDIQEEGFEEKLAGLRKKTPELAEAIDKAPENSVFFYSAATADGKTGRVQRLSFHDIYQLDKVASKAANKGRGNLVLTYQGVAPFARKVLSIEEKKPHIAVGVVHEYLGMKGHEMYGTPGADKALASRGFTTQDVILKSKWGEAPMPEPSVLTHDEYRFERLEDSINSINESIKVTREELAEYKAEKDAWSKSSLEELTKKYVLLVDPFGGARPIERTVAEELKKSGRQVRLVDVNERVRQQFVQILDINLNVNELSLKDEVDERDELLKEQKGLSVENLAEQRRIADLKAKFTRLLSKADLLILPRLTLINVAQREYIPNELHNLDQAQVDAIKDFMKAGKPVLFCLGPSNESSERFNPLQGGQNRIEDMLEELGFKLPKQTVLFNVESKSFAQRRPGILILGTPVEPPSVKFEWEKGPLDEQKDAKPNPIRTSLNITTRSIGKDEPLALRLRHPRPVYYMPETGEKPTEEVVFMQSDEASWNEGQPFPSDEGAPRYDAPKPGEMRGTLEEERRGPFPLAVAVETKLPKTWYEPGQERKEVRLAVVGHGGVFMGETLTPVKEKLLLDTVNWLLGRDDLLSQRERTWEYPRVAMSATGNALWQWGTRLGLPLLFVYLGFVMLMVRHMR